MAASVRIEDEAFSDVRFEVLAALCQLADSDHARGKVAKLWRQCTAQHTYVLPESVVRSVLGPSGVESLLESQLGERSDGGIRLRGTRGRIEWLKKLRKNAQKGGKARAAKRQPNGSHLQAKTEPPPSPPVTAPVTANREERGSPGGLASLFDKVDLAGGDVGQARNTKAAKHKAASNPDHQAAIDGFHNRFKAAYGTKPTWDGKSIGLLSSLLKRHPLTTLLERMDFMFAGKAKWPPGPYSAGVFVQHFDRWVDATPSAPTAPIRKLEEL